MDKKKNEVNEFYKLVWKYEENKRRFILKIVAIIFMLIGNGILWYQTNFWVTFSIFMLFWGQNISNVTIFSKKD